MPVKVSVVTPIYNCAKYLKSSITSILRQTFKDYEFIIINDGSSDSYMKEISFFHDKRIKFVDNKVNKGIAYRTNEAICMSSGEYIAIHDGDDISLDYRLEKELDIFSEHKDVFCVGGHAILIDENGKELRTLCHPPITTMECMKIFCEMKNPIINPSAMFRKSDFMKLGGYDMSDELRTVPDLELWGRALLAGLQFYNIQKPLVAYRINPTSITRTKTSEMLESHAKILKKVAPEMRKMLFAK